LAWKIEISETAKKQLKKLAPKARTDIASYLRQRIAIDENPRRFGAALQSNLKGLWKYRVGDYRLLCDIQDERILVLVLEIGHRRKIYGGH